MIKITEPTLLLDERKCRNNIKRMATKAASSGVRFRPHFKTHQSLEIGEWFKEVNVDAITVSSVKMAEYFSDQWKDITIAIPFNILELERINLLNQDCMINLCVMHAQTVDQLSRRLTRDVGVYIKIDVGYHRTGLEEGDPELDLVIDRLEHSENVKLKGFLSHAGHTYHAGSTKEINSIDRQARNIMNRLKARYHDRFPDLELSLGDTPSCSVVDDFAGLSEIRPGNFVFYDMTQHLVGSCQLDDIAVAMACPVIAKHKDRLIIHGGGVHFARDSLVGDDERVEYGWVVETKDWSQPIQGLRLTSLSQEHGTITGPRAARDRFAVGDIMLILPVHSCMTANSMKYYFTLDGLKIAHLEAG